MKYRLAVLLVLIAGGASAQALVPPGEIVIYVNNDVRNTRFVEPLVCKLAKIARAPVRAKKIDMALTDDLLETSTQFSPRKLAREFNVATAGESELANPFRYLIVDHDLKVPEFNYVFSETYTPPLGVISVARLAPASQPRLYKRAAEITLGRVYKLMLKSVAVMAGLKSTGCVMMFPGSVSDLDAKSSEYCPDDRNALVAARVIREAPSASCSEVVAAR